MKNTKNLNQALIISLAFFFLLLPTVSNAQLTVDSEFNPNNIISDEEMFNSGSMNLDEIQRFLNNQGSYLASYSTTNAYGDTKTAAEIIYDAVNNNYDCSNVDDLSDVPTQSEKEAKCRRIKTINPKLLLVTLEKEMSLISINPTDETINNRLKVAMGYACPDDADCSAYYYGFGKQVNTAAWQFWRYMTFPNKYNFRAGQSYVVKNTVDPYCVSSTTIVTPQNQATASLYNYTPHVFNGNYNVYKIWKKYFPKTSRFYPDGTVLQVDGSSGVWLIDGGRKKPFANYSAFISRFKPEQIIKVEPGDLSSYPDGEAIKFGNYSIVQTPDKKIFLLVDKEKRQFENLAVFKKIGFNAAEIEPANQADLENYIPGKIITATTTYATGVLFQDSKTSEVFYVENNTKAPVDKILLTTKYKNKKITKKTTKQLSAFASVKPVLLDEGSLVQTNTFPTIYLISGGKKRPFADETVFTKLNYNSKNIITVSPQFLYNYDMGDPIL